MISVEEARTLATEGLEALPVETVPLAEALDRSAGADVRCTRPLPGFTNSAMDGYALRHADLSGALHVGMVVPCGSVPARPLAPGEAARIFTGAPIPEGADTVVMQEDTEVVDGVLHLLEAPRQGQYLRHRGGDIDLDELVVTRGQQLGTGRLAMLAAQGHRQVIVGSRPVVAILPNGDELVPIDAEVLPGQVPNTNAHMLAAQVRAAGGLPLRLDPVRDDADALTEALRDATSRAQLVLTTGGMSVGDFDFARDALRMEGQLSFYKVRLKPGKPLGLGRIAGVPVLGLPGNPVSAYVGFELFGRPMVRTLAGFSVVDHPRFTGVLQSPVRPNRTRPEFLRCDRHGIRLFPWVKQGSSMISSLLHADCLALIPSGETELPAGTEVQAVQLVHS